MREQDYAAPPTEARARSPLGREFRLYAVGRVVSVVGDRIALIALVFLVIHLSRAYAPAVSLFYVARLLPSLLAGLIAGVAADHFDRRRLMIGCDVGRAVLLAAVPAVAALNLWTVYPTVFALNIMNSLFDTSARAALPDVVSEDRLTDANAILNGIATSADFFYGIGGALIFALGYRLPFFIDAATFLFSALTIAAMRIPRNQQGPLPDLAAVGARVKAGFRYLVSQPFLKWGALTFGFAAFAGGIAFVVAPLYANRALAHSAHLFGPLRSGAFRFSVMEVALGMGAVGGSALTARIAKRFPRGLLFGMGMTGAGLAYGALAFTTNMYVALACVLVFGLSNSAFVVAGFTLIQTLTPSQMRGRVLAAVTTLITASLALGSAVSAGLLAFLSYSQLWLLIGVIIVVATLFVWERPEIRRQH